MPRLHIALQDGFAGDRVRITVDGRQIYSKDAVSTRTRIGLADSVELTHGPGVVNIDVRARDHVATIAERLSGDLFVGLSLSSDGHIAHRSSERPFRYAEKGQSG
jgi:hypothetical protein